MIEMKIKHIAVEQESKSPIVFLTDMDETRYLPIWIGPFEAQSIVQVIESVRMPRPMTHDLLKIMLDQLGAKVQRIVISDLQDQTFFARIFLEQDGREIEIDARPSDSLALALRCKAPIFVTEVVVQQASYPDSEKMARDKKQFKEFIEQMKAEMFSRVTEGPADKTDKPEEQ